MAAGTLTLTNNSDAVAGAGTAFLTDLAAGDFIVANVGGIAYTLPVNAIASDTALTIVSKFAGPTMSGLAWFIAKREQQAMITAALVAQNTEALRVLNYDKANWQAVFSVAGDITVTMPDSTQFTGPSWQKVVTLLEESDLEAIQPLADQIRADALQVAADKSDAETAAGLALSAKADAETAAGASVSAAQSAGNSASDAGSDAGRSESAALRAEAAANTIDTTAFLRKDGNLEGIEDPAAAREVLNVYSQGEVDDAIANAGTGQTVPVNKGGTGATTATEALVNLGAFSKTEINARIGYSLISTPTNVALDSRVTYQNPFGNNTPVYCLAEIFHAPTSMWITAPNLWTSSSTWFGVTAAYHEGDGIILITGKTGYCGNAAMSGSTGTHSANYATPSPIRIHVWKVAA